MLGIELKLFSLSVSLIYCTSLVLHRAVSEVKSDNLKKFFLKNGISFCWSNRSFKIIWWTGSYRQWFPRRRKWKSKRHAFIYGNKIDKNLQFWQIIAIGDATQLPNWRKDTSKYEVIRMTKNQFILPGFIDCHIHAPQMPNIGLGLNMELLDWLKTYTFPMESQYKDTQFAAYVYAKVVVSLFQILKILK